ncbi:hypothetical protein TNIN_22071 [Trichonephila inaurata madagascariensis]|uniref:Uncharacterized protein n=1 Tax=Trichonephila inaurata madagascariensis TaxID=2747483 RepID=A0A8X7CGH3_9ARAC|nr:hypothetical protein TNIN_22071 [Trichonephila inaurata madagascariensis]
MSGNDATAQRQDFGGCLVIPRGLSINHKTPEGPRCGLDRTHNIKIIITTTPEDPEERICSRVPIYTFVQMVDRGNKFSADRLEEGQILSNSSGNLRNTPSGAELVRKKFGPSLASFGKIQFSSVHPEEKEEEVGWIERMCRLKALEGWFGGNGKQEKAGSESSNPIGLPGLIGKNRFQSFLHPLRRDQPKRDKERKLSWRVSGVLNNSFLVLSTRTFFPNNLTLIASTPPQPMKIQVLITPSRNSISLRHRQISESEFSTELTKYDFSLRVLSGQMAASTEGKA